MKCSVIIFVLSAVVLVAQPGEGFLHLLPGIIKDVGHGINGLKQAVEQADQQMDQQDKDQLQIQKRSFQQHKALQRH
uniref:Uncharacterized protein n=1 Tax=Xiphophorus couchianus TaxID=32473 RepID=A0A3B5MYM4_9TELE